MSHPVTVAIESGRVNDLRACLSADPEAAEHDVPSGDGSDNSFPPLHLVCDAFFRGQIDQEQSLALADALLEAGVDLGRVFPQSGDTYLISAASLGAELVGLRLFEHGVDVHARGLFDATALHWCAFMGLTKLAPALADAGSELELRDTQYDSTPLQWGLHAWTAGTNGCREGIPAVLAALVERGALVPPGVRERLQGEEHAALRSALG